MAKIWTTSQVAVHLLVGAYTSEQKGKTSTIPSKVLGNHPSKCLKSFRFWVDLQFASLDPRWVNWGSEVCVLVGIWSRLFFPKRRSFKEANVEVRKSRWYRADAAEISETRTRIWTCHFLFGVVVWISKVTFSESPQKFRNRRLKRPTRHDGYLHGSHQEVGWPVFRNVAFGMRNSSCIRNSQSIKEPFLDDFSWFRRGSREDRNPRFCWESCEKWKVTRWSYYKGNREEASTNHSFLQAESNQWREHKVLVEHVLHVLPLVTMRVQGPYFPEVVRFPRSGEHKSCK